MSARRCVKHGLLSYDEQLERFCLETREEWASVYCGEMIGIRVGAAYVWGRMEREPGGRWFVVFPAEHRKRATAFTLRTDRRYDAKVYW